MILKLHFKRRLRDYSRPEMGHAGELQPFGAGVETQAESAARNAVKTDYSPCFCNVYASLQTAR